jgi:hypothetical protein
MRGEIRGSHACGPTVPGFRLCSISATSAPHRKGLCQTRPLTLLSAGTAATRAAGEPLLTQGIGLQSCVKLGPSLKPGAGLDHLPNALLFYWFQGYLSAANIYLLNEYYRLCRHWRDRGADDHPARVQFLQVQSGQKADRRDRQVHPRGQEGRSQGIRRLRPMGALRCPTAAAVCSRRRRVIIQPSHPRSRAAWRARRDRACARSTR